MLAEDWRDNFPPYPLEVFRPLRGVEKTSGKLGSEKGIHRSSAPEAAGEVLAPSRKWLSQHSHTHELCPTLGEGSATQ